MDVYDLVPIILMSVLAGTFDKEYTLLVVASAILAALVEVDIFLAASAAFALSAVFSIVPKLARLNRKEA